MKKSYYNGDLVEDIVVAIELLLECNDSCNPTSVLRTWGMSESPEMRTLVLLVAKENGFSIKSRGKGYRIESLGDPTLRIAKRH